MKDMGRNQRFAIVVDHGKVIYAEVEKYVLYAAFTD